MAITKVDRADRPEVFERSRDEFVVAAVCDCGWHTTAQHEKDLEGPVRVHLSHFCPNRCG